MLSNAYYFSLLSLFARHTDTSTPVPWTRLIRFKATDGRVLFGEPILPSPDFDLGDTTPSTNLTAKVLIGSDIFDNSGATYVSNEIIQVTHLLGPLVPADVPSVRCIGLNFKAHSEQSMSGL